MSQKPKRTVFTPHERIGLLVLLAQVVIIPIIYYFAGTALIEWLQK